MAAAPPPGSTGAPSPIKDAIDTQSGRFEFFKQTLVLGSAGVAGIAALFTDASRIPSDEFSKLTITLAGGALIAIVAFATMGLSTYANFLNALAREAGLGFATKSSQPSQSYSSGIIRHAQIVIIGLFVAWISLTAFAAFRLFFEPSTSAETALATARTLVSKEIHQPPASLFLARFRADTDTFRIAFSIQGTPGETEVTVSKKDGTVIQIVNTKTSPSPNPDFGQSTHFCGFAMVSLGCVGPFRPGHWRNPDLQANPNEKRSCRWIDVQDAAAKLRSRRQDPPGLLLFIGSTDKSELRPKLRSDFGSNQGLARARAEWARTVILNSTNFPPASAPQSLVLTVGPAAHGPDLTPEDMEYDRKVELFALWFPEPSSQVTGTR